MSVCNFGPGKASLFILFPWNSVEASKTVLVYLVDLSGRTTGKWGSSHSRVGVGSFGDTWQMYFFSRYFFWPSDKPLLLLGPLPVFARLIWGISQLTACSWEDWVIHPAMEQLPHNDHSSNWFIGAHDWSRGHNTHSLKIPELLQGCIQIILLFLCSYHPSKLVLMNSLT